MRRFLTVILLSATVARASFCGDSMIPYSLEVLADGQPILGCARPTCFGWAPNGRPYSEQATFYSVHGTADGIVRQDRATIPPSDMRPAQFAHCSPTFAAGCPEVDTWVGGVAPLLNLTAFPTSLRCCSYEPLRLSEDRGVATVSGGQIVVGGEVLANGAQYAFDYVADIAKQTAADGRIYYSVAMRRFQCLPLDSNIYTKKDDGSLSGTSFLSRAFQDPNVAVNQPLPPPQGQGLAQNAIVEEIVQTEGIQFPPGTNFQPVPPPQFAAPPPAFAPAPAAPAPYYYYPQASYGGGGYQQQLCFSGDMLVELADGSTKRMDHLEKEDLVRAGDDARAAVFLPVKFWLHREPKREAEFYRFETEDGHNIKLTALHYIYKGECAVHGAHRQMVLAETVKEGDCLFTAGSDAKMKKSRVTAVTRLMETGIYAPMTSSGQIVVNGVLASCYSIVPSHHIPDTFFSVVNAFKSFFGGVETDSIELPLGLPLLTETFASLASKRAFEL